MQPTSQFPRWQIGYTLDDQAAAADSEPQTDDGSATEGEESSSSRSVIETVVRVTASTESLLGNLSEDPLPHRRGCNCSDGAMGMIEFQNNAGTDSASVTSSSVVATDGNSSDTLEIVINTPGTAPDAPAVRQLVVKFDSREDEELAEMLDLPPLPEGNPRKISHPGNTIGKLPKINLENIIRSSTCGFPAENLSKNPQRNTHGDFCENSQGNPITIPDRLSARNSQGNNARMSRRNPARISLENPDRISQNNVIRISMEDPTMIHEGDSPLISLREVENPSMWNYSLKQDGVDSTDKQERNFPSWQWESLANSSNVAGTEAPPSEGKSEAKGNKDTGETAGPKRPSLNEKKDSSRVVTVRGSRIDNNSKSECCQATDFRLRAVWLIMYYLVLWAVIAFLTWGLLELSLLVTSRGKYPYYMSPHSFCMSSPAIGFVGCDPEPGKVTTFDNLTNIADKINAALGKLVASARNCDSPAAAGVSLSEDALRIPCSMERFAAAMRNKVKQVLADRPALLVQIKRHFGYLPAKGPAVTVQCKSHLSLKYFSWNGSEIVESQSSGTIPTDYFPMLSLQHSVPSVLVAINSVSKDDWSGKEITVKCTPSDGGSGEFIEKSTIVVVNA